MLIQQTTTLKDLRAQLSNLVNIVAYSRTRQDVVVTKLGKPIATLINYEEYERLMNPALRFTKSKWNEGFEYIDRVRDATRDVEEKVLDKVVARAVKQVRSRKK